MPADICVFLNCIISLKNYNILFCFPADLLLLLLSALKKRIFRKKEKKDGGLQTADEESKSSVRV